jgi:hypothetical protein
MRASILKVQWQTKTVELSVAASVGLPAGASSRCFQRFRIQFNPVQSVKLQSVLGISCFHNAKRLRLSEILGSVTVRSSMQAIIFGICGSRPANPADEFCRSPKSQSI